MGRNGTGIYRTECREGWNNQCKGRMRGKERVIYGMEEGECRRKRE